MEQRNALMTLVICDIHQEIFFKQRDLIEYVFFCFFKNKKQGCWLQIWKTAEVPHIPHRENEDWLIVRETGKTVTGSQVFLFVITMFYITQDACPMSYSGHVSASRTSIFCKIYSGKARYTESLWVIRAESLCNSDQSWCVHIGELGNCLEWHFCKMLAKWEKNPGAAGLPV